VKPERVALAEHRPERAPNTLAEGGRLLEHDAPAGAVNRFDYGAFYAARVRQAARALLPLSVYAGDRDGC
jgi:hypothetical protein